MEDTIYTKVDNLESVIVELLETEALKRLENVSQLGVPKQYYGVGFSRLEHSKGVFMLLRNLGATLEEQIAGLLHDISHMAFSHVIDHIYSTDAGDELLQDLRHEKVMSEFDSSAVLKKYGFDPKKLSQIDLYSLLDRPIPFLCADRIDYSLRQFPLGDAKRLSIELKLVDGRIVFSNEASAKEFALLFLEKQVKEWGAFWNFAKYLLMAEMLKEGLMINCISEDDLWMSESEIIKKLLETENTRIRKIHNLLSLSRSDTEKLPVTGEKTRKKFRYVDPEFVNGNEISTLSVVDKEFSELVETEREKNRMGIDTPDIGKMLGV